jgi:hypothetical protein
MSLIKLDHKTMVDTSQISIVSCRGDGFVTVELHGGERLSLQQTLDHFAKLVPLVMLDETRGLPKCNVASIRRRRDGAHIHTMHGAVHHTEVTFATLADAHAS